MTAGRPGSLAATGAAIAASSTAAPRTVARRARRFTEKAPGTTKALPSGRAVTVAPAPGRVNGPGAGGGRRAAGGGRRAAGGGRRVAGGGWRAAGGGRRAQVSRQRPVRP